MKKKANAILKNEPFSREVDREYLFKLSTCKGKAANIQTERFLFSTHEILDVASSTFLKEYIADAILSEGKPIKRTLNVLIFACI